MDQNRDVNTVEFAVFGVRVSASHQVVVKFEHVTAVPVLRHDVKKQHDVWVKDCEYADPTDDAVEDFGKASALSLCDVAQQVKESKHKRVAHCADHYHHRFVIPSKSRILKI